MDINFEEAHRKYSKGSLIKKINAKKVDAQIEIVSAETIDRINQNVLQRIKNPPPSIEEIDKAMNKIFK